MYINEIILNGVSLDLSPEEFLDFTAQVNTIASVDSRQASYTPSYRVPKTAKNVRALDGLGIASDTSQIPYNKPNCVLLIEGFAFIVKGWLNVKETTPDYYSIYIYSGIINFFKAIENKTLGDLNLSEVDHVKNLASVVASFHNPNYKYLITDYNGLTHYGANDEIINIDYLIPSVLVKYLWDKIFSTYGFTYEGSIFTKEDFTNLWLTYPKTIAVDETDELISGEGSRYVELYNAAGYNAYYRALFASTFDGSLSFTVPATAQYKITLKINNSFRYPLQTNVVYRMSINQEHLQYPDRSNAIIFADIPANNTEQSFTQYINLTAGDVISFYDYLYMNGFLRWTSEWEIKIEQVVEGAGDFTQELKDFSISDFCKEIMTRFCLTPFTDEFSNLISFKTMPERIVDAPVVDWSDKYIERKSEDYVYGSYAIRNKFMYQYADKEATYHDGYISINNVNLEAEKTVFKSKTYSPEKNLTDFKIGSSSKFLRVFKMYDREPQEEDGQTVVKYKGLDKRFHFVKKLDYTAPSSVAIGSKTFDEQTNVSYLPLATFEGQDWLTMILKYYPDFGKILNDSRIHEIDLYLRDVDLLTLNLGALYYFQQEQQFYILDKLKYKGGKISSGNFIRVRPDAVTDSGEPVDPTDTEISIVWGDGSSAPKSGYYFTEVVKIQGMSYPVDDELIAFEWERYSGGTWVGLGTGVTPHTVNIIAGTQMYRMRATSVSSNIFYSNSLTFNAPAIFGRCYEYTATLMGANSGDDLTIYYRDCDGEEQTESIYAAGGTMNVTLSLTRCALDGTMSILSRGDLVKGDECSAFSCHSYKISKVANTMEDTMNFDYISCEGHYISQTIYPDFAGQTLEETICARFDTVNSDSGYIDLGTC